MRFRLLFVFLFLGMCGAQADTLDIYRVYFHGKQVGTFSEGQIIRVVLKSDSVRITDSLHVDVVRDAPCASGCTYSMIIFGNKGPMYVDSSQHAQSFSIPLRPLMQQKFQSGTTEFTGYYTEYPEAGNRSRVISFKIILQGL